MGVASSLVGTYIGLALESYLRITNASYFPYGQRVFDKSPCIFHQNRFLYDLTVEKNKETDVYDLSEIDRTNNTAPAIR